MIEVTQLTLDSVFNGVVVDEFVYAVVTKVMTSQTCAISLVYFCPLQSSLCYWIKKELRNLKPRWCKEHEDWTLYLFSPESP